jgi:hypothetical protein
VYAFARRALLHAQQCKGNSNFHVVFLCGFSCGTTDIASGNSEAMKGVGSLFGSNQEELICKVEDERMFGELRSRERTVSLLHNERSDVLDMS